MGVWSKIGGRTVLGVQMDSWKKAAVLGCITGGALLFMKKRYAAGVLATGAGLAVLASEYPEKFEQVRQALPDYFERAMQVMEMAAKAGRRISEAAGRSAADAWDEIGG
jgi:Flp pilus assembly protein TadB